MNSHGSRVRRVAHKPSAGRPLGEDLRFFAVADLAELLRVSERTVRRWIDGKLLKAHRMHGVVRIAEADLRAFVALHREP